MVVMTPRLRNLLIGLGISVVIMIVDQVNPSDSGSSKKPRKVRTAAPKKVVLESSASRTNTPKTASIVTSSITKRRFSRASQLVGWQRNPFNSVTLSSEANTEGGSINSEQQQDIEKSILLKNLERYNVEIVAEFNNEKVVLIDNRRFRQGEYLNNDISIERIENDQITFRNGNTTVTKTVGN